MSILGLSSESKMGEAVCGLLNRRHSNAAKRPSPTPKPNIRNWAIYSHQHLALGLSKHVKLTSDEVKAMQYALAEKGFYHGEIDGQVGRKTRQAHEQYRQSFYHKIGVAPTHPLAEAMVRIAEREAAARVVEEGGENRGKRVEEYQMVCGRQFIGASWCAAFVCWCLKKAASEEPIYSFALPREAGAFRFEDWAVDEEENGVMLLDPKEVRARRGDIIIFDFSHIGMCTGSEDKGGLIPTVEGNTTPAKSTREKERNGGGVYLRKRETSLVRSIVRIALKETPDRPPSNVAYA